MRLPSTLLAAALLVPNALGVGLDPNDCHTTNKERDGNDFILVEQSDNRNVASLSKILKKVTVADVFEDGNHQMTTDVLGWKHWEETPDFNDMDTDKWVPQGISSTVDALEGGTYEGKNGWVVSWHRPEDKGVRVTFVDRSNDKYRHVLLVYPHAADNFKEVAVHAGGIVWYGDKLWVVDTHNGIRVFDLTNIWQVSSGDGVGKVGDEYTAAGYKYVIPQLRWYKWSSPFDFWFSYISLDRTDPSQHTLLVGEFRRNTSVPVRMVKYPLNDTTGRLRMDGKTTKAKWAYCVDIERVQGAVSANGRFYISRSNGADHGDMFGWVPGNFAYKNADFFPESPEDLSYDKRRGGRVYGLTENRGKRFIMDYDIEDVDFS